MQSREHALLTIEELTKELSVGRAWLTEKLKAYGRTVYVGNEMRIARSRIPLFLAWLEGELDEKVEKMFEEPKIISFKGKNIRVGNHA
jgi:hypothetical protein